MFLRGLTSPTTTWRWDCALVWVWSALVCALGDATRCGPAPASFGDSSGAQLRSCHGWTWLQLAAALDTPVKSSLTHCPLSKQPLVLRISLFLLVLFCYQWKKQKNQDEHSKTVWQHDFPQMELSCLFGGPKIHVFTTFGVLSLASIKNKSTSELGKFFLLVFFLSAQASPHFFNSPQIFNPCPSGGFVAEKDSVGSFFSFPLPCAFPPFLQQQPRRAGWVPHKVRA